MVFAKLLVIGLILAIAQAQSPWSANFAVDLEASTFAGIQVTDDAVKMLYPDYNNVTDVCFQAWVSLAKNTTTKKTAPFIYWGPTWNELTPAFTVDLYPNGTRNIVATQVFSNGVTRRFSYDNGQYDIQPATGTIDTAAMSNIQVCVNGTHIQIQGWAGTTRTLMEPKVGPFDWDFRQRLGALPGIIFGAISDVNQYNSTRMLGIIDDIQIQAGCPGGCMNAPYEPGTNLYGNDIENKNLLAYLSLNGDVKDIVTGQTGPAHSPSRFAFVPNYRKFAARHYKGDYNAPAILQVGCTPLPNCQITFQPYGLLDPSTLIRIYNNNGVVVVPGTPLTGMNNITVTPNSRDFCVPEQDSTISWSIVGAPSNGMVEFVVAQNYINANLTTMSCDGADCNTAGGTITVKATGPTRDSTAFRPIGPARTVDKVNILDADTNNWVECTNVTFTDKSFTCRYPPGVGANIKLNYTIGCQPNLVPITGLFTFNFGAPLITDIQLNTSSITISGINFGSSSRITRWTTPGSGDQVMLGNQTHQLYPCAIVEVDHTRIVCSIPAVTLDQQKIDVKSLWAFVTVANRTSAPLIIEKVEEKESQSNVGMIVGIVVAIVAVIILIAVIIAFIIIRRRAPKDTRTVEMVPVSKRDFTPLIFGEEVNFSSEEKREAGDLRALEELLIEDDLNLAFFLGHVTQITEADKIAKALVIIFEANNKAMHIIKAFVDHEIDKAESPGTLFRSNSLVSKMFKFYSRLVGLPYCYETIGPEVTQLIHENLGLEIDPDKMDPGADFDEMRWTLMAQSQKVLKAILNSVDEVPNQFKDLCYHLSLVLKKKFPDNVKTTIGGFIFLRFFCPAISAPETYGIVDEPPSASSRRLLILMTKVLQNLSNNVEFGSKEPYMVKMNDFIHSNQEKLSKFFSEISKHPEITPDIAKLPKDAKDNSLIIISQHLQSCMNKITDPELNSKLKQILITHNNVQ